MTNFSDFLREQAVQRPDKMALHYADDGRTWTFRELDEASNRLAQAVLRDGLQPQSRVAYLDKNAPEFYQLIFGCGKANVVSVAVNWRLAPKETEYVINNSEASILIVGEEFLPHVQDIDLPLVKKIVVVGEPTDDPRQLTFDDWIGDVDRTDPHIPNADEDTFQQMYTSGTTGLPKGVELTHEGYYIQIAGTYCDLCELDENTRSLTCLPLYHMAGPALGMSGMSRGGMVVLTRNTDTQWLIKLIREEKITHGFFVPAQLQFILDMPDSDPSWFESLKLVMYGASPISNETLAKVIDFMGCGFIQGYGSTEAGGSVTFLLPKDHDPIGPRAYLLESCGSILPNTYVKIVDIETLEELPEGETGEIWVNSPRIMKCYWRNDEATQKTLVDNKWVRTGDAGYVKDGYLYIQDRVIDMIVSGGMNVYPAEIESALMEHSSVADVAIVGIPHKKWGESPLAVIVRADDQMSEQDVIDYCRDRLAHYKCPTSVTFVDSIPRNASGKILKRVLREPYWEGMKRRVS